MMLQGQTKSKQLKYPVSKNKKEIYFTLSLEAKDDRREKTKTTVSQCGRKLIHQENLKMHNPA